MKKRREYKRDGRPVDLLIFWFSGKFEVERNDPSYVDEDVIVHFNWNNFFLQNFSSHLIFYHYVGKHIWYLKENPKAFVKLNLSQAQPQADSTLVRLNLSQVDAVTSSVLNL